MRPCSLLFPPNSTALLSSIAVKVRPAHGGGLSPVVAGQLHTPTCTVQGTLYRVHVSLDVCATRADSLVYYT